MRFNGKRFSTSAARAKALPVTRRSPRASTPRTITRRAPRSGLVGSGRSSSPTTTCPSWSTNYPLMRGRGAGSCFRVGHHGLGRPAAHHRERATRTQWKRPPDPGHGHSFAMAGAVPVTVEGGASCLNTDSAAWVSQINTAIPKIPAGCPRNRHRTRPDPRSLARRPTRPGKRP